MNITLPEEGLPLTPQVQQILVALMAGRNTRYGVMRRAEQDAGGLMKLAPGTVYPALERFVRLGWAREIDVAGRWPLYELTSLGEQVLEMEIDRQAKLAKLGGERRQERAAKRQRAAANDAADFVY